jgi:DNA-binding transcriptional regulator YiaG
VVKAEIPAAKDLLDAIARAVVTKASPLAGMEMQFLRKRLGIKQSDFAGLLEITPEQLSRLENGHSSIGGAMERYVRLAYTFMSKDGHLKKLAQRVQDDFRKWATSIHREGTEERITAKYKASQWVAEATPAAA